jgi:hypothetical protein
MKVENPAITINTQDRDVTNPDLELTNFLKLLSMQNVLLSGEWNESAGVDC